MGFILVILIVLVWWFWQGFKLAKKAEPSEGSVERLISTTEERLKELDKLSTEEKAKREKEREVLNAQKVPTDVLVEGVKIIKEKDRKIIKNQPQNYNLELPLNLVMARSVSSDWLEFFDQQFMCEEDPSCDPLMRLVVNDSNSRELSLDKWMIDEEKKIGASIYSPRETLALGGQTVLRITEIIPGKFDGYYYYWSRGKKIYYLRISRIDDAAYHKFIETIKFE